MFNFKGKPGYSLESKSIFCEVDSPDFDMSCTLWAPFCTGHNPACELARLISHSQAQLQQPQASGKHENEAWAMA